jgi:chromate reductase, NAD(P)H dehydrogenase (quinone)
MNLTPKILAFSGSLRKNSFNKMINEVAKAGAVNAGAIVTVVDLNDFPLPIYNDDDYVEFGQHENALALQEIVANHDGFLISTPSFNGSMTGALKNTFDWLSRQHPDIPREKMFKGKYAAILSASPGSFGGIKALKHVRDVLTNLLVNVLPQEIAVPFVREKFELGNPEMQDQKYKRILESVGKDLTDQLTIVNCGRMERVG